MSDDPSPAHPAVAATEPEGGAAPPDAGGAATEADIPEGDAKVAAQRAKILDSITSSRFDTLEERVAWILSRDYGARNSDAQLYRSYWEQFHRDAVVGGVISLDRLGEVTPPPSLTRARARVQNRYGLFVASPAVRKRRKKLSEEEKQRALDEGRPEDGYTVYIDESGKTGDVLVVGSAWFIDEMVGMKLERQVDDIKASFGVTSKLHFKDIQRGHLGMFRRIIDAIVGSLGGVTFFAVTLPRRGISSVDAILERMHFHLLVRGIHHHHQTGRAPLPRILNAIKEREEEGRDALMMEDMGVRLRAVGPTEFPERLVVERMVAAPGDASSSLQIADLYTSAVARQLNAVGARNSPRDEVGEWLLAIVQDEREDMSSVADLGSWPVDDADT